MIDADRLPIIAGRREPRQEYPARRLRIETGIVLEPMPNMGFGPPHERRTFGHPPAFDLQRPQILSASSVDESGAGPPAFLISYRAIVCSGNRVFGWVYQGGAHVLN